MSVENPSELRREYEALAAKNVGDQELLNHMKKLIISPPAGEQYTLGVVMAVVRSPIIWLFVDYRHGGSCASAGQKAGNRHFRSSMHQQTLVPLSSSSLLFCRSDALAT